MFANENGAHTGANAKILCRKLNFCVYIIFVHYITLLA